LRRRADTMAIDELSRRGPRTTVSALSEGELSSLRLSYSILKRYKSDADSRAVKAHLDRIQKAAAKLQRLLNDTNPVHNEAIWRLGHTVRVKKILDETQWVSKLAGSVSQAIPLSVMPLDASATETFIRTEIMPLFVGNSQTRAPISRRADNSIYQGQFVKFVQDVFELIDPSATVPAPETIVRARAKRARRRRREAV